jgi:DNA-directed RNA polymerase specialized sigma24 family protein
MEVATVRDDRPDVQTLLVSRGSTLQRAAYLLTGDWTAAEDLLSVTLSRAVPKWGRLGYDDPFLGVLGELVRTWSVWWRRRWAPQPGEDTALATLSRRQRATAVLVLHVGLPESRVASLLDTSTSTVHGWLASATADPQAAAALDELASDDPPPSPRDRVGAARRAATRRHRRAAALAVVVVVAAVGGPLASRSGHHPAPVHTAKPATPSWTLPWPSMRSEQLAPSFRDAATAWALRAGNAGLFAPPVTWYVARSVAGNRDLAVVFEVNGSKGHRLVAGWAPRVAAQRYTFGFDSPDPWTLYDVPAPLAAGGIEGGSARSPVVSFYVPRRDRAGIVTDWVVAVTSPNAKTIAIDSPSGSIVASLDEGFGTVALPRPVTGPATILASGSPDRQLIGVEGNRASSRPVLTVPRPPALPANFRVIGRLADEGPSRNDLGPDGLPGGRVEVAIRCVGPSTLTLRLGGPPHQVGTADCDGRTHVVTDTRSVASARPQTLLVRTSPTTAYSLTLGVLD